MKRKNFCGLTLLAVLMLSAAGASPAAAQVTNEPPTLPLETAVRLALENNPEILVLQAGIASARGEVASAQTWQNPEITFAPGFDAKTEPSETQFHADFGLEQTIEWPGKRTLWRAVAEKNVALRRLALEGFRSQLAVQVRRAYFTLLTSREAAALREQRLTLAKEFLTAAQKRVEGGFAPDFEAAKAEVEIVAAQKLLRGAQAEQDAARVTLNTLMGQTPDAPFAVTGALPEISILPPPSELRQKALALNPALKIQEAEAERTGLSLQAIRKSRLPDFKVGPSVEYMPDEQIVGFGFSLPLPFWDKKKGEIATATAEQAKALAELEKLRREIGREVTIAAQNFAAARDSLGYYTPAMRGKLKESFEAAGRGYAEGRTPLLLFLETQRTYFDLQSEYMDELQKLYQAGSELESAAGFPLEAWFQTQSAPQ